MQVLIQLYFYYKIQLLNKIYDVLERSFVRNPTP